MAEQAVKDFELLQRAGVDASVILHNMGPEAVKSLQDMARTALQIGGTIPESMRPILQGMLDMGQLVDENGEALTDLSRFDFAKPLETMVEDLIKALDRLIAKFGEIPGALPGDRATPRGYDEGGPQAAGGDYLVTRPTHFLAGEAGPERVTFRPQRSGSSGSGGTITIVTQTYLDAYKIAEALTKVAA